MGVTDRGRFALQIACRATVESFFKSLKAEMIWRRNWQTRRELEVAIFPFHGWKANHERATEYINGLYNPHRRHSALG
jgi:transposase InsO family protein